MSPNTFLKTLHHQFLNHKERKWNWTCCTELKHSTRVTKVKNFTFTRLFCPSVCGKILWERDWRCIYCTTTITCRISLHPTTSLILAQAQPSQESYILALQRVHHPQCFLPFLEGRPQLGGQCSLTLMLHRAQTFHQSYKGKEFHCRLLHVPSVIWTQCMYTLPINPSVYTAEVYLHSGQLSWHCCLPLFLPVPALNPLVFVLSELGYQSAVENGKYTMTQKCGTLKQHPPKFTIDSYHITRHIVHRIVLGNYAGNLAPYKFLWQVNQGTHCKTTIHTVNVLLKMFIL